MKLGERQYSSAERAFRIKELFEEQPRVSIIDICNKLRCCRQTASKYLDIASIYMQIYQATDVKPYQYSLLRSIDRTQKAPPVI